MRDNAYLDKRIKGEPAGQRSMFHLALFVALAAGLAGGQGTPAANGTLLDNINNSFELRYLSLMLRTYCGQPLMQTLNNSTANMTFFAPTDVAMSKAFNISSISGAADFNCSSVPGTNATTLSSGCLDLTPDFMSIPFVQASPCLPLIFDYHVVPDQFVQLANTSVAVLPTMLNDTRFVHLAGPQVLLLNQTSNGTWFLNHGLWPPAQVSVNRTISGVNGIAYLIDQVLLPPLNLTTTAQSMNLTHFANALGNNTSTPSWNNVTVFAPLDSVTSSKFNVSSYIFPGIVLYDNFTSPAALNLTDMSGHNATINVGNYSISIMGNASGNASRNASVVIPNILIEEGVLHIINGTISANSTTPVGQFFVRKKAHSRHFHHAH